MRGLRPLGLAFAAAGTFLLVLFAADVADPGAFCPPAPCFGGKPCAIPGCVPWSYPWIGVIAGVALTFLAIGLIVLARASSWTRIKGWAGLLVGVAILPFAVIGLMIALPSSIPWAQAIVVVGMGAIVIAAVTLGLSQNGLRAPNESS